MMGYIYQNNNPFGKNADDCVIRAIATATGRSWNDIFLDLMIYGFIEKDLPNENSIWGKYLVRNGFVRHNLPDTCPLCYTVRDFVHDHKYGIYILADGSHAIAAIDGYYIDTYDSGDRTVLYYFKKEV